MGLEELFQFRRKKIEKEAKIHYEKKEQNCY